MLIPNPFYAAYGAGAFAADCEPVYLPATHKSGFLPDLDALDDALLARTVACYIASPSNPQGAVADRDYLDRLVKLARRFGFLVFADECYCEIYSEHVPPGMLEAPDPISPMSSSSTRFPSVRACPACALASRPGTGDFSVLILNCETSRRRKCRCPRSTSRSPLTVTRPM